jgi:NAD dependent epimerase/dehydratase family enzyme
MLIKLLHDESASGPYNLTAPNPVTNAEFTATLAETLHRSTRFAAPAALIKLSMGERACLLLEGQRILPRRMKESHYQFAFETLTCALKNILG